MMPLRQSQNTTRMNAMLTTNPRISFPALDLFLPLTASAVALGVPARATAAGHQGQGFAVPGAARVHEGTAAVLVLAGEAAGAAG